jgi:O-antigen ligase
MLGPSVAVLLLALSLAWAVFLGAGVSPYDWVTTLLYIGCISLLYWFSSQSRQNAPPLKIWVRLVIFALPCYIAFQLTPLPLSLLRTLSPARAALVDSLAPVLPNIAPGIVKAPLSVNPPAAVFWFFAILGYIATFFLVRELAWQFSRRPWALAAPLIAIAACQAAIGLSQVLAGRPSGEASGTYTSRDHFCGLLEMVLPLTLAYGLVLLRRRTGRFSTAKSAALAAAGMWAISALLLLAVICSSSEIGVLAALCSLFVILALTIGPRLPSRLWRQSSLAVVATAILLVVVFSPADRLVGSFARISSTGKVSPETRLFVWQETLPLIAEFGWFGCGLGGFESAFLRYQGIAGTSRFQFANNDYLQYLAELGFLGCALLAAVLMAFCRPIVRGILRLADEDRRLLAIGCAGSFLAAALHSLVDFNMYIPANAMTLAWIAGLVSINGLD